MRFWWFILMGLLIVPNLVSGGIFDEALAEGDSSAAEMAYTLNGYIRSDLYLNRNWTDFLTYFGETSLQLGVNKGNFGKAYADVRIKSTGTQPVLELREAYLSTYFGPMDLTVGNQIVVWGRADGINPTDIINPRNFLSYSVNDDDQRLSNFIVNGSISAAPFRLNVIAIPGYVPSAFAQPAVAGMTISEVAVNNKMGRALRLNLETSGLDGSVSYFNGYSPQRGLILLNPQTMSVGLKPYEVSMLGADFSTTVAGLGVRGDVSYRFVDDASPDYIPFNETEYVLGLDRSLTPDITLILQYRGKYIPDWSADAGVNPVESMNRLLNYQQEQVHHFVVYRLGWMLLHETLQLENFTNYSFTTKDLMMRFRASYSLADNYSVTVGTDLVSGDTGSLSELVKDQLAKTYFEVVVSF